MKKIIVAIICWLIIIPSLAHAHSLGASFEQQVGSYFVDIGYDPEFPEAGQYERFDFELWESEERTYVPHTQVWVRILKDERTLFASGIHRQSFGPTTLLFTFPEPGDYILDASYRDLDGELASVEFPLTVSPPKKGLLEQDGVQPFLFGLLAGAILVGGYLLLVGYKRTSPGKTTV